MPTFINKAKLKFTSIYYFRYNHPTSKLHVWDKAPLIIPLDVSSKSLLAVNIHWLPAKIRMQFIKMVLDIAEKVTKGKQTKLLPRLYYTMIKSGKFNFAKLAIRRYHISGITSIQEIIPDMWPALNPNSGRYKARKTERK